MWPVRVATVSRPATSHTAPCCRRLPVARVLPSGLNATGDRARCGRGAERAAPRRPRPTPHRAVVAAGGEERAVRAERHRGRSPRRCWPGRCGGQLAGGPHVPQPDGLVGGGRWRGSLPSGLNATADTAPVWPVRTARSSLGAASSALTRASPAVSEAAAASRSDRERARHLLALGRRTGGPRRRCRPRRRSPAPRPPGRAPAAGGPPPGGSRRLRALAARTRPHPWPVPGELPGRLFTAGRNSASPAVKAADSVI